MSLLSYLDITLGLDCGVLLILLVFVQVLVNNFLDNFPALQELFLLLYFLSLLFSLLLLFEISLKLIVGIEYIFLVTHDVILVNTLCNSILIIAYLIGLSLVVMVNLRLLLNLFDLSLMKLSDLSHIDLSQEESYHET